MALKCKYTPRNWIKNELGVTKTKPTLIAEVYAITSGIIPTTRIVLKA